MRGDVEVAHAEREVDRIDVLERRGEKRQVAGEEDHRARRKEGGRRGQAHAGHTTCRRSGSLRLPSR